MGRKAHIQTKHIVEYGNGDYFNHRSDSVFEWLAENDVMPMGAGDYGEGGDWEISKDELRKIPDEAYRDLGCGDRAVTADELREFVSALLDAPTGDWAYVSWF